MSDIGRLLVMAAGIELGVGLGALAAPQLVISLLLGATSADATSQLLARVLGLALVALAICCWSARADSSAPSRAGVVAAMTFYNAAAALLLVTAAAVGSASGVVLWLAVAVHAGLAVAFIAARGRAPNGN